MSSGFHQTETGSAWLRNGKQERGRHGRNFCEASKVALLDSTKRGEADGAVGWADMSVRCNFTSLSRKSGEGDAAFASPPSCKLP